MRAEIAVGTAVIACVLAASRGPLAAQPESPPRQVVSDRSPVRTNSTFLSRFRPQTKSFQRGDYSISLIVTNLPVLDRDYEKVSELQTGQLLKLERATAIKLRTEVPLRFGSTEIPIWNVAENYPGVYSLWLQKVDDGWHLVFNDEADAWGTQHNPAADRAEIPIAYRRMETDGEPTVELNGAIEGLPASLSGTQRSRQFQTIIKVTALCRAGLQHAAVGLSRAAIGSQHLFRLSPGPNRSTLLV